MHLSFSVLSYNTLHNALRNVRVPNVIALFQRQIFPYTALTLPPKSLSSAIRHNNNYTCCALHSFAGLISNAEREPNMVFCLYNKDHARSIRFQFPSLSLGPYRAYLGYWGPDWRTFKPYRPCCTHRAQYTRTRTPHRSCIHCPQTGSSLFCESARYAISADTAGEP